MVSKYLPAGVKIPILQAQDVANAVFYALETPEHVEVSVNNNPEAIAIKLLVITD